MYEISFSNNAAKSYLKLSVDMRRKLDKKLAFLTKNPYERNNNIKPLKGMTHCYRLRIGDWRVVYEVVDKQLQVYVIKIAQRKEVYAR